MSDRVVMLDPERITDRPFGGPYFREFIVVAPHLAA